MRTVTNLHKFMTVGDLREFLNSDKVRKLNSNAFVWIPVGNESWHIDCLTHVSIEKVSTPEDNFPEEDGLCLYAKKIANKVQD